MAARRVLISGGAGFIGQHLTLRLRRAGWQVVWLDNLDPQVHGSQPQAILPDLQPDRFVRGDVTLEADWRDALDGVQAVVHLAAQTGTSQSMYQVHHYTQVNVAGTALLWDILTNQAHRVKQVALASSRSVYGEGAWRCEQSCGQVVPMMRTRAALAQGQWDPPCPRCGSPLAVVATPEESIPSPASLYACSKLAQEQLSRTMGQALGIPVTALRLQNVYGPGQSLRNPYTGVISIFSNQLRQGLPVNIYEDGAESRDFVYVSDVTEVFARALEQPAHRLLNVGSGSPTSAIAAASTLKALWASRSPVAVTGEYRVGDIRHNWADIARLRRVWPDWSPTELSQGLSHFVDWAKTQPAFSDGLPQAMAELRAKNLA